ncbi:putative nucleotidyltransferase [Pullulanibacillus pueri]|uniref:Nucleotidyltransferase domain-containing protein n=1 Tax=Pullulanibacillus pueri TaxID=1437324 RepID=A0A8J2ZUY0_9BACL|nr:hypothetical protein [Pullulanibacillus pueri]MBM7681208.1 putative nucleotidyltransferase [Pullulanibacillus pueri]GGH78035.1 hypothetical protein GCM10007096_10820 [Pullulanibacillus pueri]
MESLQELVNSLIQNPNVIGIIRYGSRKLDDLSPGGDFDIVVISNMRPKGLESIHFDVGDIPIDLSLRRLEDLRRDQPLSPTIDPLLPKGEILFDRQGILNKEMEGIQTRWKMETSAPTEEEMALRKFGHRHVLDKVRHRFESNPLLCHFLLSEDMYWKVISYFSVRSIPYEGESAALIWLKANDPKIYSLIEHFYALTDLSKKFQLSEQLTDLVLAPIEGPWKKGEILALPSDEEVTDLQAMGKSVYVHLFGRAPE